jgi:hypothetical protein
VPAALQVKLPRDVALRSVHAVHGMIKAGPSWPSGDVGRGPSQWRTQRAKRRIDSAPSIELPTRSTLRTTRLRDTTSSACHSDLRIPTSHLGEARFPVLRCVVATARCSYVASVTPGFHALRDRRNPAAGPVIAATSMHAAGCAFRSSIFQRKAVRSFKRTVGT